MEAICRRLITSEPSISQVLNNLPLDVSRACSFDDDDFRRHFDLNLIFALEILGKDKLRSESSTNFNDNLCALQVTKLIDCVCKVLAPYISVPLFYSLGFQGNLGIPGATSSCCYLTLNEDEREVFGGEEVINNYSALSDVVVNELVVPAALSEVIGKLVDYVKDSYEHDKRKYFVSVITMDKARVDSKGITDKLVLASELPMYTVIAGVEDSTIFKNVEKQLTARGIAIRDILHCVPNCELRTDGQGITKTLLEEVPKHCQRFKQEGIRRTTG